MLRYVSPIHRLFLNNHFLKNMEIEIRTLNKTRRHAKELIVECSVPERVTVTQLVKYGASNTNISSSICNKQTNKQTSKRHPESHFEKNICPLHENVDF